MTKRLAVLGMIAATGLAACGSTDMAYTYPQRTQTLTGQNAGTVNTSPDYQYGSGYQSGTGTGYSDPNTTNPGFGNGSIYPSAYPSAVVSITPVSPHLSQTVKPDHNLSLNPYRENFFKNYGTNPFVESSSDPLSTFSLDVDTGAYTYGRSEVNANRLPAKDSVRTEEYLNAFNYFYPQPGSGSLAIHTEFAPSYFGTADTQLLRIGIQAKEVMDRQRSDATLTLVIDVSGSMNEGNRLTLVKQSVEHLLNQLRPSDRVGIVIYSNSAKLALDYTQASDKQTILNVINSLRPEGSTNAEAGLTLGYTKASGVINSGGINRVILFSDGVANQGEVQPDSLMQMIKRQSESGILLTTLGVGRNGFNDALMEQLANQGDGSYAYLDRLEEAKRMLGSDLTSTLQTVAKDAKIQVVFNQNVVEQYRLMGYENRNIADKDFRNDAIDAGEVGANHSVTALYEVRYKSGVTGGEVAKVQLRYKELADSGKVQEISRAVNMSDLTSFRNASASFKLATAVAEYAEILRESVFAKDGKLSEVVNLAQTAQSQLPNHPQLNEFVTLAGKANQLQNPIRLLSNTELVSSSQNPQSLPDWHQYLLRQLGGGAIK